MATVRNHALVVIVLVGMAVLASIGVGVGNAQDASPVASPAAAAPTGATLTIEGFDIGCRYEGKATAPGSPIAVPVAPGATIALPNVGVAPHNFAVEEWGIDLNMPIGGSVVATVPPDAAPGEYHFVCTEPGHEAAGMVGTLVVE